MRVGIVGSRNCQDFDISVIGDYLPVDCTEIISGGAAGIDAAAEELAAARNIAFRKFLPDYQHYGKRAPLERNLLIVKNSDMLLAFWDCGSKGTAHVIDACIRENVPVRIIRLDARDEKEEGRGKRRSVDS